MSFVYRIASQEEWDEAVKEGVYKGGDMDKADGFIHLSTAPQARFVASAFFADRSDLVLLTVLESKLAAAAAG